MDFFNQSRDVVRRLESEIEFAELFAKLQKKNTWDKMVIKAAAVLAAAVKTENLKELKKAAGEIESLLAPVGKIAKKYTCWCVGHGHMDMNWMWNWAETVAATNDMFITVLKLMEEFPEFRFSQSQTSVYEIARKYNPELFARIKQRVAEGRWEITASEWVEGDKNLASGESLVRHMLYTRRYMAEHFGLTPDDVSIAWNPDTFGHAHTIPMIYTRGGVQRYYMCRGGESPKPPVFWWSGPDGSRLLVNLEHTWYNDTLGPHNIKGLLSFCEKTGLKDWMLVYGIGDHGGGPTRRDLHLCQEMNSWPIYPNFRFATTREYYEILEKNAADFPVVNDELNYEFTGCYTSQSDIKKVNRLSECLLERAEYSAVLADTVLGKKNYPYEELREAWRATLLGHFHDILPGSGVKATREYSSGQFQNTAATAGMIITNSLRAVAKEIDTSFAGVDEPSKDDVQFGAGMGLGGAHCGGISSACHVSGNKRGVVVFNPVACRRNEVISVTVWDAEHDDVHTEQFTACTADGLKIPAQRLNSGQLWGHRYVDIAVPVSVPAMSYSSLVLESVPDELPLPANAPGYSYLQKTDFVAGVRSLAAERPLAGYHVGTFGMENEFVRVVFDRASGGIVELVDRSTGINVVSPEKPAALLEYVMERPAGMSAWLIREAKKSICPLELTSFAPIQYGPHTAAYEGVYKVGNSTIKVRYSLSAGESQVRIAIQADWMECGGPQIGVPALRLRCPFAVNNAVGTYEIPFGSIKRKPQPAQEVPSQKFVDVTGKCLNGKIGGCAVFNDSKYGYCLDGSTLTCTLIRSSYEPDPLPEQGKFEMKFSLQPHGRELSVAELMHAGAAFNQPLQIVSTDIHVGHMPANGNEAISCMPDSVIITGVKKSEDEDAIIVRLLETQGKDTIAKVKLNHDIFGQFKTAEEIDLLERSLGNAVLKIMRDGYFSIKMSANSVASVKLKK